MSLDGALNTSAMNMIDAFIDYLRDEMAYSSHTVTSYGNDLRQWREFVAADAENFDPMTVTTNDTRAWVAALGRQGMSGATIRRKLSSVRSLYQFLIRRHGASVNPAAAVRISYRSKSLPKFVDPAEMAAVLDSMDIEARVASDDFESVRNDLIINILYQTGMRASELISLTDDRIDMNRSELKVLGKRNKERIVPFGPSLKEMIDAYRAIRPAPLQSGQPLLTDADGNPLRYDKLYRIVRQSLDGRVSSTKRSPHVLRHTFATDMLNSGADLTSVRKLLGHSSLATTQIYTHVSVNELYDNYRRAHPRATKK